MTGKSAVFFLIMTVFICFFSLETVLLYSQTAKKQNEVHPTESEHTAEKNADEIPNIPAQSQYSNRFQINEVSFTKDTDYEGKGEILEIRFALRNQLDEPQDIYLFVIATYEKDDSTHSSFDMPVPEKERIRSFVPYPDDINNFEYYDEKNHGVAKLIKYPKNPKAGIDPLTGKPYHLVDVLNIRTRHLSKYRNNYFFFNEVSILIFDKDGNPLFRQLYSISGVRH